MRFYKLFDEFINSIPEGMLFAIRLFALVLWLAAAFFVGINSWYKGSYSVYRTGSELPHLQEKALRERNRAKPRNLFVTDIDKFAEISGSSTASSNKKEREALSYPIARQDTPDKQDAIINRGVHSVGEQISSSSPSFRSNSSLLLGGEKIRNPLPETEQEVDELSPPKSSSSFHSSAKSLNLLPVDE